MKQIYMEQTLLLIAHLNQNDPSIVTDLLSAGTLKETESGIRYLLIETKTEDNDK